MEVLPPYPGVRGGGGVTHGSGYQQKTVLGIPRPLLSAGMKLGICISYHRETRATFSSGPSLVTTNERACNCR